MSYADRIRQASGTPEAMLIIAEGLDEVLAAGTTSTPERWGSWGDGVSAGSPSAAAPQPEQFYEIRQAQPNQAAIDKAAGSVERLQELVDRSPTPANLALLEQAQTALLKASQTGEYLDHSGEIAGEAELAVDPVTGDVILPPATPERKALRRKLAEALDLPGFFGPLWQADELREQIFDAYEKGGPLWLYHNRIVNDHDIFVQLPAQAKTLMVRDIMEDSQRMAWEFQRDIMKEEDVEGAGLAIAQDNLNGISAHGGTPLRGE